MSERRSFSEEMRFAGAEAVETGKQLVRAGNARHVRIRHADRTIMDLPLTIVVVAAILAPGVAVLGAILVIATECTVSVEREGQPAGDLEG